MKQPNYGEAIKSSWELIWHHKILWVLGILAIFVGQFGLGDFIGKIWLSGEKLIVPGKTFWQTVIDYLSGISILQISPIYLACLLAIILTLLAFIVFVSITAQGALVLACAHGLKNNEIKSIVKFWHISVKHFWKLFYANFVAKFFLGALLFDLFFIWSYLFNLGSSWSLFGMTASLAIVLFLAIVVSTWLVYTVGYIMIDEMDFYSASRRAFVLFSNHVLVSIELSIITLLLGLILVAAISALILLFYLPMVLIGLLATVVDSVLVLSLGFAFSTILGVGFLVVASGIFNTFIVCAWMQMFMRMHKEGLVSKVMHHLGKLLKR